MTFIIGWLDRGLEWRPRERAEPQTITSSRILICFFFFKKILRLMFRVEASCKTHFFFSFYLSYFSEQFSNNRNLEQWFCNSICHSFIVINNIKLKSCSSANNSLPKQNREILLNRNNVICLIIVVQQTQKVNRKTWI